MLIFMLKNVIPTFVDLFESSDMVLPLSTRILISLSNAINENGLLILIILLLITAGGIIAYRRTKFGYYLDKFKTTKSIFGKQRKIIISSEIARSLSITHKNSMTILDGLIIHNSQKFHDDFGWTHHNSKIHEKQILQTTTFRYFQRNRIWRIYTGRSVQ